MNAFEIRRATNADDSVWDRFVQRHRHGTPCHLSGWRHAMSATFGYRDESLLVTQNHEICAVLPLFYVKNPLSGAVLLSSPFAVYGGVLADSDEVRARLRQHLEELGRRLRVQYVELRNIDPEQCLGWPGIDRYVTFIQDVASTDEAILSALPRETRRMTRRALEQPYTVRFTRELRDFERLYLANLRKLGTPAFPSKHFQQLLLRYPDADVMEVVLEGQVVAAVFNLYLNGCVYPYYGASDPAFNRANPNNYMYYRLLCEARERGLTRFDFGRSKRDSGSYSFKSHWGMDERCLPYEIFLVERKTLPNFSPQNPKYQKAIELWQRMPLPLTRLIGPFLIRLFP